MFSPESPKTPVAPRAAARGRLARRPAWLAASLLAGCAAVGGPPPAPGAGATLDAAACRALFRALDARVAAAGVADARAARIADFRYLRVDRFLASAAVKPASDDPAFGAWVDRLRVLDREARRYELMNLDAAVRAELAPGETDVGARTEHCGGVLRAADLRSRDDRERLLAAAVAPDAYSIAKRALGLYPFTSLPFKAGVSRLYEEIRADFARPLASLPVSGRVVRYVPASDAPALDAEGVRRILERSASEPLGIPAPRGAERERLFATFAPVFEVDVAARADRIGRPVWGEAGLPVVDVARPTIYRHLSHTRFAGRTLLQVNYVVWFPARPKTGAFDLLGGRLDGITYRVTLGVDGRPLVFDSMHNCGCYHLFMPSERVRARPPPSGHEHHEEPALIAQQVSLPEDVTGHRAVLRVAHRTHYLQRLYFEPAAAAETPRAEPRMEQYALDDAAELRSLPLPGGGRRSLYGPDGLVPGTERAERWLFWPMGIASPGAMRQWGNHATAFVGRRHFDDPHLMTRYFFEPTAAAGGADRRTSAR